MRSALYTGTLMHSRRTPKRNVFRYGVAYWLIDVDELPELERRLLPVAVNRRGLVTFRDSDHFDGAPVKQAVIDFCGDPSIVRVLMLTQLRLLGYVFNPVSFYWCYRADGSLASMVSEVSNTFGERLPELLRGPELHYEHAKRLHVSPFFGLDQSYEYAFSQPGDEVWARIHVCDTGGGKPMTAVLHGRRRELTNLSLARTMLRYPFQPMQVTALIHWQAIRLWLKRVPFHHKPPFEPEGLGPLMSERALRVEPKPAGLPALERIAFGILERALVHLETGTLEVELPDGAERSFGSGPPVRMAIHDMRLFRRLATRGKVGLGESYMAEEWDADDLVGLFELLLRNAATAVDRHSAIRRFYDARPRFDRRNGLLRARRNIAYHYDLGNDLFALMLDPTMTYSCAVFEDMGATKDSGESLEDAQRRKIRRICDKLELGPGDRLLEIGCGWGGFAMLAASEYGCHVTGLTISNAQATLARERIAAAGLGGQIEIREEDYRLHQGSYTKVASVEMLEAIGEKQFPVYFEAIDRLLELGGRACVQTILVPDDRWDRYRKSPDWIERYVFPGCLIPSLGALASASARASRLQILEVDEIGPSYAETLRRWRRSFHERIDDVRALGYDRRFERTWEFYLAFCEAGFRTRALRDVQLTLSRAYGR